MLVCKLTTEPANELQMEHFSLSPSTLIQVLSGASLLRWSLEQWSGKVWHVFSREVLVQDHSSFGFWSTGES